MNKLKIEDDNMARKAIFVIISISFLQLSSTAIAQSIVEIKNHFSSTSVTAVQVLYTLPSIFIAISALLIPLLRRWISDKQITLLSLMLIILAGFLTLVAHNNIYLMYFYSMILGLGVGPIMPISSILATNQFEPQKRSKVLNFQMTAVSIGGIVICLASGVLILTGWFNYGYVFLLAIPALILCWKKWPEEKVVVQNEKTDAKSKGFNSATIFLSFVGFVFGICYFTFTANIALHFSNIGLENSFLVGIASSLLLCGGIIGPMAFIKVPDKYDFVLIIVGFISLGLGLIVFSHTSKWVFLLQLAFLED